MQIAFLALMFILGATLGSFLCCQARRLRARELHHRKLPRRSVCLHCHKPLKWHDNLPLISWFLLKGRCRYCHHKIGILEIASEVALALTFLALSAHFLLTAPAYPTSLLASFPQINPLNWGIFLLTLLLSLSLGFLAIYDGAYGELPSPCLTFSIICAIIIVILQQQASFSVVASLTTAPALFPDNPWSTLLSAVLSAALFGGLYLALYLASHGKWVGDGDWLYALAIGLVLGHPWLALLAIFIANLSATLIMFPILKLHPTRSRQIHFAPFLFFAFVITLTFSNFFISMI